MNCLVGDDPDFTQEISAILAEQFPKLDPKNGAAVIATMDLSSECGCFWKECSRLGVNGNLVLVLRGERPHQVLNIEQFRAAFEIRKALEWQAIVNLSKGDLE